MREWLAVSILAATTASCFGERAARVEQERPSVASVSGVPFYADEFRRLFRRVQVDDPEGFPSSKSRKMQKQVLLDSLIDRHLVVQAAERVNALVTSAEVEAAFSRSRASWPDEEFRLLLSDTELTPSELKQELRSQLMVRRYFADHVYSRVAVTDEEIEAVLEAHPEKLIIPERVRARHIVVRTEEEADKVARKIRQGLSFEDAAMEYSLSPEGKSGGDLGTFTRGQKPPIFEQVCFKLQTGVVSAVTPSEFGFHLFQVLEHHAEGMRPLADVRAKVEELLRRDKEREAQRVKIAQLRKAATIIVQERVLASIH